MYGHRLQIWPRDSWHPGYISLVNSLSHSLGWLFLHYLLSPLPSSSFSSDDFAFGHQSEQNFHILPSPHLLSYLCLSPQTCFLTCYKWNAPAGLLPKARAPTPALDSIYIPSQPPRGSAPVSPSPPHPQLPESFHLAAPHAEISHYWKRPFHTAWHSLAPTHFSGPLWLQPLYCHSHVLPSVSLEPTPMDETALGKARN